MVQPVFSLIQVFAEMFETEIKHELLMEIYKESLRGQYGLNRIFERTIWVGLYYLLKIDENFVKEQYGSNCIAFYNFFCRTPVLENRFNSDILGLYGSSVDDTVHSVQMDNLVGKEKMGWNITYVPANVGPCSLLSRKP